MKPSTMTAGRILGRLISTSGVNGAPVPGPRGANHAACGNKVSTVGRASLPRTTAPLTSSTAQSYRLGARNLLGAAAWQWASLGLAATFNRVSVAGICRVTVGNSVAFSRNAQDIIGGCFAGTDNLITPGCSATRVTWRLLLLHMTTVSHGGDFTAMSTR